MTRDVLSLECHRPKCSEPTDYKITEGMDNARGYLASLRLLDGGDVPAYIRNMERGDVMTLANDVLPDTGCYEKFRVCFGDFNNGTPAEGCAYSGLFVVDADIDT